MPSLTNWIETEDDFEYEEKIIRSPYEFKPWWLYISAKRNTAPPTVVNMLFERSLKLLPGSYKLWWNYLQERMKQVREYPLDDPVWDMVNNVFERSLVTMHKMPRIWLDYCGFLMRQRLVTKTRKTFDRALQSLPITQHQKIWKLYLDFARDEYVPRETSERIIERYLKLEPAYVEDYIIFLIDSNFFDKACLLLTKLVNDDQFKSKKGNTKYDMWKQLCDMFTNHPEDIQSIPVEEIIRSGISKYPSEVGDLWCTLASFHVQKGNFERSFDIFEEAMTKVSTVRDFSQCFSAYSKLCEEIVEVKMSQVEDTRTADELITAEPTEEFTPHDELEILIAKYEDLMDRRPILLNGVKLRQNPHNVHEWHKRISLLGNYPDKIVATYSESVLTVNTEDAVGKPFTLWSSFAKYYERNYKDLKSARTIFERGISILMRDPHTSIEDMATLWCEYAEMEIKHRNYHLAREILQRATAIPEKKRRESGALEPVGYKLYKSTRLWSMYVDLEESIGTLDSTRSIYDRILDLKIATPRIVLNYARYLEEYKYFEDAFKAYERGVNLFFYPQVLHIWVMYLTKFVKRYGGKKLERARDLFEQAVANVPKEHAKGLFLLYAKLEEDYGLAKLAMNVYERATRACADEDQYQVFLVYISRAAEYFGVTKTRDIYERALLVLPEKYVRELGIKYADLERKLGEIDRARAIFAHISKFCDPRTDTEFYKNWESFEKAHGNIDTFKEMLRIKRSVQATFSTSNVMTSNMLQAHKERESQKSELLRKRTREGAPIGRLHEQAGGGIEALEKAVETNPDEIIV
jgi:pre-mRNA-splicing factor SYF1